jgi:predicted aspartyl protease
MNCQVCDIRPDAPWVEVRDAIVDTGSEYSWFPEDMLTQAGIAVRKKDIPFVMANGQRITRDVGYVLIRCKGFETVDEVVFAREDDLTLLGSRTLEGFAAAVDPQKKMLVASGPLPAAPGGPSRRQAMQA